MQKSDLQSYLAQFGGVEARSLSKFQQVVARRLTQSWVQIPHVTHDDDADVTAVEEHRKALSSAVKVTTLIYFAKALSIVLREFPHFNASLSEDGKTLLLKDYVNIGIAVDGPLGLMVPILRDVENKTVQALAVELIELSEVARTKGLSMNQMEGGSMTITSLGAIGGTRFTPIINQPEVAILGLARTKVTPVWDGSTFQPRMLLPMSLSYDHRVINGADAARFLRRIDQVLSAPDQL